MGFLLGAFGKQMAGSNYRSLQAKLMKIQSRARKATRDVQRMNDMIDRQAKSYKNYLTMQSQMAQQAMSQSLMQNTHLIDYMNGSIDLQNMTEEQKNAYTAASGAYQQGMTQAQATLSATTAYNQQQIEDYVQNLKDCMLEPLKDEEELLQSEKDSLESQLAIAKQDYESCKQMEQDGAKMLKPDYTGGGQ